MSNRDKWNWHQISEHIPMEDVVNNPDLLWNKSYLSMNKNICMKVINMNLPNTTGEWLWNIISRYIQMEDVIKYPNEKWDASYLSMNKNISIDVIRMNLPNLIEEWNWEDISYNIAIEQVIKYPNETWDKSYLSRNENISMEVVNMDLPNAVGKWRWRIIHNLPSVRRNKKKSIEEYDILSYIHKHGRMKGSSHSLISLSIIYHIDRVGISIPKWNRDVDITCYN
jgi:hypothetical protein